MVEEGGKGLGVMTVTTLAERWLETVLCTEMSCTEGSGHQTVCGSFINTPGRVTFLFISKRA